MDADVIPLVPPQEPEPSASAPDAPRAPAQEESSETGNDAAPVPILQPGDRVWPGRHVREHLHRSTDADVYEVFDDLRGTVCIAKVVKPDRMDVSGPRHRLKLEADLLMSLTHPNIVRAYECVDGDPPGVLLEQLHGESLKRELRRTGDMSWRALCELGLELCSALGYLHRHGYLHMDLKPSNVFRTPSRSMLIDFNIARKPGQGREGVGTRLYMAPEQVRAEYLDTPVDVWGLGMVLYRAATGRLPTQGSEEHPQIHYDPKPVRMVRNMPRELAAAIDGCLVADPAERLTTQQLIERFQFVLEKLDAMAARP